MVVSGCYMAQNVRNSQTNPKINVTSLLHAERSKLDKKKLRGTKMSKIFFVIFGFCAICVQTKSCLIPKIMLINLPEQILSFEGISVVISQKLSKLDQNN